MKVLDIIKTANSNLLRSKLRTFLTILAVFVGSLTLTLTTAVGQGVEDYIDKQTNSITLKDTFYVLPAAFDTAALTQGVKEYDPNKKVTVSNTFLTQSDLDALKSVKNVESVEFVYAPKPAYITRDGQKKYLDNALDVFIKNFELPLAAGKLPDPTKNNEMILAYTYLEPLGFAKPEDAVGQKIQYSFRTARDEERIVDVTVTGVQINSITGSQNRITSTLAEEMYKFQFGTTDAAQVAFAYLKSGLSTQDQDQVKADLKAKGYNVMSFEDQINQVKGFLDIMQVSVNIFGIIVIVAASIGIVNTLLMAVYERTREVGLMKALGMRSRGIFAMFAFEAASIGFWGGLVGVGLAYLIGKYVNSIAADTFLKGFEGFTLFLFPLDAVLPIIFGTLLIGLLAGTLPALKAAKLDPIEALRYE
jgi:putative ABC transport system permease protein